MIYLKVDEGRSKYCQNWYRTTSGKAVTSIAKTRNKKIMKSSISKVALKCGLAVYLLILLLLLTKTGSLILLAIWIGPGLVYGIALIAAEDCPVAGFRQLVFILLSLAINMACVYFVSRDFLDVDYQPIEALVSVGCSLAAGVLFTMGYDLLILRRFSLFRTIVLPLVFGTSSSLLSATCMFLLGSGRYNEVVSYLLWAGMLSIFPLWQYLIGLNLDYHSRATLKVKNA